MAATVNRQILLASRPEGEPCADNFELVESPPPAAGDGEVLCRTLYLSLDPYMRGRMSDAKSYASPVPVGGVMEGGAVAEVLESACAGFDAGDLVVGHGGWQELFVLPGKHLRRIDPAQGSITTAVGVLGMPGITAYTGLLNIGKPAAGETVVVAAASGPVGSVVGQVARIKGARAVGIAGSPEKCRFVTEELGFDACLNHREPDLRERLAACCPDGIDVYFENVGGAVFEAVLPLLNPFARIPVCGLVSGYNATELPEGPNLVPRVMRDTLTKRLTFRGFIVWDFADQSDDAVSALSGWIREGRLRYREDFVDGLAQAPQALIGLLRGENFGKLLVRVGDDPTAG